MSSKPIPGCNEPICNTRTAASNGGRLAARNGARLIRVAQIMSVTGGRFLNGSLFQFEVASTETTQHVVGVQRRTLDEIGYPVPTIASVLPLRKATVGTHP